MAEFLIFGHKLHIGTPYRGKRFWTHRIPTSCLPTLLIFIHIEHTCVYANFSSHFSQQLLMAEIWYLVTSFIYVPHIVGSVFGPVRFLLPVCRLSWFLYTLNIYAHFSSHFSQQLLIAEEIWYLVTDSYFPLAKERWYHRWALAHSSSCSLCNTVYLQ